MNFIARTRAVPAMRPASLLPWPSSAAVKVSAIAAFLPMALTAQAQQAASSSSPVTGGTSGSGQTVTTEVSISAKEIFDSNLLMRSAGPQANLDSFGTMVTPSFALKWRPSDRLWLNASYSPELATYYADHTEDYVSHKALLNLGGALNEAKWENDNSINWVQGDSKGATYYYTGTAAPGITPVPALAGVPLRDRADQVVYRDSFKFEQPIGDFFVRPVASAFVQNFMTQNRLVTTTSLANGEKEYYENYVDRADFNFGLDAGYKIQPDLGIFLGYRYGFQEQAQVADTLAFPSYSNDYQRVLAGIEGKPASWLTLSAAIGPDFRTFYGAYIPASFEKDRTKIYIDGSAKITVGVNDAVILATKRYELPAYLGKGELDDSTFDLLWRHKFTDKFAVGLGFKLENWDFDAPDRNEWWYGGNFSATYAFTEHLSGEASYGYDRVVSGLSADLAGTSNWGAERHTASLGVKYKF